MRVSLSVICPAPPGLVTGTYHCPFLPWQPGFVLATSGRCTAFQIDAGRRGCLRHDHVVTAERAGECDAIAVPNDKLYPPVSIHVVYR